MSIRDIWKEYSDYLANNKYRLTKKRKVLSMKNVAEIDQIIASIVEYQQSAEQLDKQMKKHIQKLSDALYDFDSKASKSKSESEYLECVKEVVISLNKINEDSDFALIETVEREDIYTYIEFVSTRQGYSFDYDITEAYREW